MKLISFEHPEARIAIAVLRDDDGHVRVNVNKLHGDGVQSAWQGSISTHVLHGETFDWHSHRVTIRVGIGAFELYIHQTALGFALPWGSTELHVNANGAASDSTEADFTISTHGSWHMPI